MKKLLCILSLLACFFQSRAEDEIVKGVYRWKAKILMTPINHEYKSIQIMGRSCIESRVWQKFHVLEVGKDSSIIEVLDYDTASAMFALYNFNGSVNDFRSKYNSSQITYENYGSSTLYFRVKNSDILLYAAKYVRLGASLSAGVINYLVKYRGQKGQVDFSGASNIGGAIGLTLPHRQDNDWTVSVLLGVGISNINLDSASISNNRALLQQVNNFSAFSGSLGLLFCYRKVQVGFFGGFDRLSNLVQKQFDWNYQGKPWMSIGLGFNVFSPQEGAEVGAGDNK